MNNIFPLPPTLYPGNYDMMEFPAGLEGRIILVEDDEEQHISFDPGQLETAKTEEPPAPAPSTICY